MGDHAKFYLTTGMIARGVVVKTSPARSVWSLYRLIDPAFLVKDKILNLKVATPVKISPDPSKMIMVEPVAVPGSDIALSPDAQSLETAATFSDQKELEALEDSRPVEVTRPSLPVTSSSSKVWEVMGYGHLSSLAGSVESESDTAKSKSSASLEGYDLSFGLEKYFASSAQWYSRFSLQGFFHLGKSDITHIDGHTLISTFWGLGVGLNYHFYRDPQDIKRPITYGALSFGMGKAKDHNQLQEADAESFKGNMGFFSVGVGVKYYLGQWGSKIELDYYRRVESYTIKNEEVGTSTSFTEKKMKALNGPRLLLGILYRF